MLPFRVNASTTPCCAYQALILVPQTLGISGLRVLNRAVEAPNISTGAVKRLLPQRHTQGLQAEQRVVLQGACLGKKSRHVLPDCGCCTAQSS